MGISRNPAITTMKPTIFKIADLTQNTVFGIYYTLLDVTSGRGKLTRISVGGESDVLTSNLTIKITVDGVSTESNSDVDTARVRGFSGSGRGFGSVDANSILDWFGEIIFYNSLKIEWKRNSGSSATVFSSCDYSLE